MVMEATAGVANRDSAPVFYQIAEAVAAVADAEYGATVAEAEYGAAVE